MSCLRSLLGKSDHDAAGLQTPMKGAAAAAANSSQEKTGLAGLYSNLFVPSRIVKTEIQLDWMPKGTLAFTLDNVFTPDECAKMIHLTETECSYGAALVNIGGGRQQLMSDVRNNSRAIVDDPIIAEIFFERIKDFLPQEWTNEGRGVTCKLAGLNERLRFLKYTPGQRFAPHYDGTYERSYVKQGQSAPELSFVTVQLYLNSGEADGGSFEGGSTAFINHQKAAWDDEPAEESLVHCIPRVGRVLIFQHAILHQGSKVTKGTKYCLRTDAMYQPPSRLQGKDHPAAAQGDFPVEEAIDLPQENPNSAREEESKENKQ